MWEVVMGMGVVQDRDEGCIYNFVGKTSWRKGHFETEKGIVGIIKVDLGEVYCGIEGGWKQLKTISSDVDPLRCGTCWHMFSVWKVQDTNSFQQQC